MKKKQAVLPVAAVTLLVVGGSVLGLATQQKEHAQTPITQVQTFEPKTSPVSSGTEVSGKETPDATSGSAENENDGPSGHQDPQGANVNHQFDGIE